MPRIELDESEDVKDLEVAGLYVTIEAVPGLDTADQEQTFIRLAVGRRVDADIFRTYGTRDFTLTNTQHEQVVTALQPLINQILQRLIDTGRVSGTVKT